MDKDGRFWVAIWSLPTIAVCIIVLAIAADDMYGAAQVSKMVQAGADPLRARCSVYSASMSNLDCNLGFMARRYRK